MSRRSHGPREARTIRMKPEMWKELEKLADMQGNAPGKISVNGLVQIACAALIYDAYKEIKI